MPKRRVDPEVSAMEWILTILRKLDPEARKRVLDYVLRRVEAESGGSAPGGEDEGTKDRE